MVVPLHALCLPRRSFCRLQVTLQLLDLRSSTLLGCHCQRPQPLELSRSTGHRRLRLPRLGLEHIALPGAPASISYCIHPATA